MGAPVTPTEVNDGSMRHDALSDERRRGAEGRMFHPSGSAPEVFLPFDLLSAAVREAQMPETTRFTK